MWKGDWEEEKGVWGWREPELGRVRLGVPGEKVRTRRPSPWTSGPHSALRVPLCPQNPDIVLVHYLNVPALEDCGKGCSPIFCSISSDRREWLKWSREELLGQLKPMCKAAGPGQSSKGRVDLGASHGSQVSILRSLWGDHVSPSQEASFLGGWVGTRVPGVI